MSFVRRALVGALLTSVVGVTAVAVDAAHAAAAVLTVSADAVPDPLGPTQIFTSTVTVTNTGDADSVPTLLTTSVPKYKVGLAKIVYTTKSGIVCSTYAPRYGTNQKRCTVPALTPGQSITLATIAGTPPPTIPFAGATSVSSVTGAANTVSLHWHWLQPGPTDLSASGYASPGTLFAGGSFSGQLTVADAAYGAAGAFIVHLGADLPAVFTMGTLPAGVTCAAAGDGVDCAFAELANGASAALPFTATPTTTGTLTVSAAVDVANTVSESNEANNTVTIGTVTVVGSAVSFAESFGQPATVDKGTVSVRSVTITNAGGSPADNVSIIDHFTQFPFVARFSDSACHRYVTYSGRPTTAHYNGVGCTIGTIPANTSVTYTYGLAVPTALAVGTYGHYVTVATTSFQAPGSVTSTAHSFDVVMPASPAPPTMLTPPTEAGNAVAGEVVTGTNGTWLGLGTLTYALQWQRCNAAGAACVAIPAATGTTYTVSATDAGSTLRFVVSATNGGGTTTAASTPSTVVIGSSVPSNTTAPLLIAGLEKQPGFAWGVTNGTWAGTPTIAYGYQWYRCNIGGGACVEIVGATSANYVLQTADVFHSVRVLVTATNSAGSSTAWSDVSPEIDPVG